MITMTPTVFEQTLYEHGFYQRDGYWYSDNAPVRIRVKDEANLYVVERKQSSRWHKILEAFISEFDPYAFASWFGWILTQE